MSIFQSSVVTKHLKTQNKEKIAIQWELFKTHFHNPTIQDNIRNSKEEQYQGEFLIDLFVNVLGYTKNPTPNFNITTEYKNVKDSKKADGAIVVDNVVKAVIELKGTNTTDLGKIEVQAFGYKNNQPECTYVITSNFEKLRFYIDNAIEHIEFNLFTLTKKEFELLYLCLAFENIQNDTPNKIKKESISQEDAITKKLYNDYSLFKRELHQSLVILNPQFDALTLFQKSQKLLDRFLFLFFAEDRQLLPPNSVRLILEQWVKLKDLDAYTPLFDRFKKYFDYLNTGYKGKQYDVYAYNGGLFKADTVLDTITIDDDLLYKHTLRLSEYDFDSEVDVNILGHIFENSLNELDEIKAQLEGQEIDKSKTKRKKDGVFYTPKYITKYIVENTVGKLCEEKKAELEIVEDDYITDKKRQKKTIKGLIDKLTEYRNWLLQLTICDPACGSGAFLNQALDFLILEHRYIDELQAKLFGDAMVLSDVEKSILENNLFGVDLNEESVEIAKLSLWLRTAQPNRKLNDLNNNIKCGNSLIDDPEIAGEKAFNWQLEFPHIFDKGGFDVVIGNPPWSSKISLNESKNIADAFNLDSKNLNLFYVFFFLANKIVNKNGIVDLLVPQVIIKNISYLKLREQLINEFNLIEIVDFGVFPGVASTTVSLKYSLTKADGKTTLSTFHKDFCKRKNVSTHIFDKNPIKAFSFEIDNQKQDVLDKLNEFGNLSDVCKVKRGIELGQVSKIIICKNCNHPNVLSTKYYSEKFDSKCEKCTSEINSQSTFIISSKEQSDFYNSEAYSGKEIGRYETFEPYYIPTNLNGIDFKEEIFEENNLLVKRIATKPECNLINKKVFAFNTLYSLYKSKIDKRIILILLNSRLISFYYELTFNLGMSLTTQVTTQFLRQIPISIPKNHQPFIEKADLMLSLNKDLKEVSQKFQRALEREFSLDSLPKKLQDWYLLSFAEFIKELENKKVKLSLSQKAEWEDYFLQESKKALELKTNIDTTDKEIDQMIYELYGLTKEEIEIVEKS